MLASTTGKRAMCSLFGMNPALAPTGYLLLSHILTNSLSTTTPDSTLSPKATEQLATALAALPMLSGGAVDARKVPPRGWPGMTAPRDGDWWCVGARVIGEGRACQSHVLQARLGAVALASSVGGCCLVAVPHNTTTTSLHMMCQTHKLRHVAACRYVGDRLCYRYPDGWEPRPVVGGMQWVLDAAGVRRRYAGQQRQRVVVARRHVDKERAGRCQYQPPVGLEALMPDLHTVLEVRAGDGGHLGLYMTERRDRQGGEARRRLWGSKRSVLMGLLHPLGRDAGALATVMTRVGERASVVLVVIAPRTCAPPPLIKPTDPRLQVLDKDPEGRTPGPRAAALRHWLVAAAGPAAVPPPPRGVEYPMGGDDVELGVLEALEEAAAEYRGMAETALQVRPWAGPESTCGGGEGRCRAWRSVCGGGSSCRLGIVCMRAWHLRAATCLIWRLL